VSASYRPPAAGSPTLTTSTPMRAIAGSSAALSATGGFFPVGFCRPSRSVSSTTLIFEGTMPIRGIATRSRSARLPGVSEAPSFQSKMAESMR
jgi:hypothetical protein